MSYWGLQVILCSSTGDEADYAYSLVSKLCGDEEEARLENTHAGGHWHSVKVLQTYLCHLKHHNVKVLLTYLSPEMSQCQSTSDLSPEMSQCQSTSNVSVTWNVTMSVYFRPICHLKHNSVKVLQTYLCHLKHHTVKVLLCHMKHHSVKVLQT